MSKQPKDEKVETIFAISYDAEGDLANHTIDAKSLGNAILGMDELIKAAAKIVSNGSSEASLKVLAPAQEGSLEVVFAIFADPLTTKAILAGVGFVTTGIAVGTATAIEVIEKLRDRKIDKVTVDVATKIATLEVEGEKIEIPERIAQLVTDKTVRTALHKVIKAPVENIEGARVKFLGENNNVEVEIPSEKIKLFEPIKVGSLEEIETQTNQVVVRFITLNFKGTSGWRIQTREGFECGVSIEDDAFMQKVTANEEAFQKDKLYTVDLEHEQTRSPGKTRNTYTIKKVINELAP
ncbi:hypothetical protein C4K03_0301 [Pseudomonas synxantha]|uniref:Uncharacterized protein n=1 Tax=Pseudomonas synxantha TaxID=47883 RepID=A0A3G7U1P4_9PSED|nr:hypothetical protein [Pseudomonas synxantha]AZE52489.1 hypothetical protein C4K03_0301 [Pseudomonas synxantha]